jgi:hypothetical protein
MRRPFVLIAVLATAACGGGQSLTSGPVTTTYNLGPLTTPLTSPLAVGQSITIPYHEQKCREQHYSDPAASHDLKSLGCDAYYVPGTLVPVVVPIFSTNAPCGATATQQSPGTIFITRTGPGDPNANPPNGAPLFWCTIDVMDPATGALNSIQV